MKQATYTQAGDELRIYQGSLLVATFKGGQLVALSRAALAAYVEGQR